jgi:hypothetical protein
MAQMKGRINKLFNALTYCANTEQNASINQLILLAAFFLPLSLATDVLSIQSRFSELHLLLFDFVGVFLVVRTLALLFFFIS